MNNRSNHILILLSSLLALSVPGSLKADPPIQKVQASETRSAVTSNAFSDEVSESTQRDSKKAEAEPQTPPRVKSVPDRRNYSGEPAKQSFPDGFDRRQLTPPPIDSVEEFLHFAEKVRAIPYKEYNDEKRHYVYYRELMFAKNRAIVAAADDLLARTKDPTDLFQIHKVKFKEFRVTRFSSPEERKAFSAYSRELSGSPDAQELVTNTVFTAMLDATENQHMTLVKMLFDHLDEYGVNEPAAQASENIYRMYPAEKFPELRPVLIRGLAERFEKAAAENPDLREMNAKLRAEAAKLNR